MTETSAANGLNILVGIRDNLLKPMTEEIKQAQKDSATRTQTQIVDLEKKLDQKITQLSTAVQEFIETQASFKKQLVEASTEVKWNE